MSESKERILHDEKDGVGLITLSRPNQGNAFYANMREDLLASLRSHELNRRVKVILIQGAGRHFCTGTDIKGLAGQQEADDTLAFKTQTQLGAKVILACRSIPKPIVCALKGDVGCTGLSLALACDLRVAEAGTTFTASAVGLGLHPNMGITYHLPKLIGSGRALDMLWHGRKVSDQEALDWGLVGSLAETGGADQAALDLSMDLAQKPKALLGAIKQAVYDATDLEDALELEAAAQIKAFESPESKERIKAFLEAQRVRHEAKKEGQGA